MIDHRISTWTEYRQIMHEDHRDHGYQREADVAGQTVRLWHPTHQWVVRRWHPEV